MGRRPEGHFWRKSTPAFCSGATLGLARAALNPRNPPPTKTGETKPFWLAFPIYSFPDGWELEADGCLHSFIHSTQQTLTRDPVLCQALSTQKWSLLSGYSQAEEATDDNTSLAGMGGEILLPASGTGEGSQRRGPGEGSWEEWEGRRNSRNQGSEERLMWWRGFCDCYFCPPLNEAGLGAVGAGRKEKRPTPSWRSSGWRALVQVPAFASPAPSWTQGGGTLFSRRSLWVPAEDLVPQPGLSFFLGWKEGCPWPARPHQPLPSLAAPAAATPTAS